MLYIDVGSTLRGRLRTGIQRVVRALSHELAANAPDETRLIAFDLGTGRYFALREADLIQSAGSLAEVPPEARAAFDFDDLAVGDVWFAPDASWIEPVNQGALFRQLKSNGVIVVVLNHDVIPLLLPEFFPATTLVSFAEAIADQLQYADYALATSNGVARDLRAVAERFLSRSMTTRVIGLGADFAAPTGPGDDDAKTFATASPELAGLRFLLSVGTVEPRKNHALLLEAFDRLDVQDAGLLVVGRKGWMADDVAAALNGHPAYGERVFWYEALDDAALLALYRRAHASVLQSRYEGYGLPAVEALAQGCATLVSDGGSLPEVTQGHAAVFERGNGEALGALLDRLYGDTEFHAALKAKAASFRPTSWREAGESAGRALEDIVTGASQDFAAPARQLVYLSLHPEILDLSLASVRANLRFIDRIVVLTSPSAKEAIEAMARRHFPEATILTDDAVAGGGLPADHQARNTWLRKQLYVQDAIDANFLAADEDAITLRSLDRAQFQISDVHAGYYFLEDMATWLAGSPTTTSFDRGMRNGWRVLAEAAYPTRAFASHMPQIINKSLAREIFGRFVLDGEHSDLDEWPLYFNVASQLYPRHFGAKPYGTLGWPMRPGDWLPEIAPFEPAFENYYKANYERGGMFEGLAPLGDLEAKTRRTMEALEQARRAEIENSGAHSPSILGVVVTPQEMKFVSTGTVLAGNANVRRVLVVNGAGERGVKGTLDMFVTEPRGAVVRGESIRLGEVCWIPLLPPEAPGLYPIRLFATLDTGARLEARGLLTVIGHKET